MKYCLAVFALAMLLTACTTGDKQQPFNKYLYDKGIVK